MNKKALITNVNMTMYNKCLKLFIFAWKGCFDTFETHRNKQKDIDPQGPKEANTNLPWMLFALRFAAHFDLMADIEKRLRPRTSPLAKTPARIRKKKGLMASAKHNLWIPVTIKP